MVSSPICMYDDECNVDRFKVGIYGAHLLLPFQCNLCIFRSLFKRNPREERGDLENLSVIRRMNLDLIWSREPTTIYKNMLYLNSVITIGEAASFTPQLPCPGPFQFEDTYGWSVAFAMLIKSRNPGKHSKAYTQYASIRKLRSAASNLYHATHS